MTRNQINSDITRLLKYDMDEIINNPQIKLGFVKEFNRIYDLSPDFKLMNVKSIRIMLRLNLLYRIKPLHSFGLQINLDDL